MKIEINIEGNIKVINPDNTLNPVVEGFGMYNGITNESTPKEKYEILSKNLNAFFASHELKVEATLVNNY